MRRRPGPAASSGAHVREQTLGPKCLIGILLGLILPEAESGESGSIKVTSGAKTGSKRLRSQRSRAAP